MIEIKNKNDLIIFLKKIGETDLKITDSGIAILTDDKNRRVILDKINSLVKNSERRHETTKSSVGHVNILLPNNKKFYIVVKPKKRQGKGSAGLDNEDFFVNIVKSFLETQSPLKITFVTSGKKVTYKDIVGIELVSSKTQNRAKADVVLITNLGKKIPISLKKDNAVHWESADLFDSVKNEAKKILDDLINEGIIQLKNMGSFFKISGKTNAFVFEPDQKSKIDFVFGNDILKGGGIVAIRTFSPQDFQLKGDELVIHLTDFLKTASDIKGHNNVYVLIRNDSTRRMKNFYPGLRMLAVKPKRITKNVLIYKK